MTTSSTCSSIGLIERLGTRRCRISWRASARSASGSRSKPTGGSLSLRRRGRGAGPLQLHQIHDLDGLVVGGNLDLERELGEGGGAGRAEHGHCVQERQVAEPGRKTERRSMPL